MSTVLVVDDERLLRELLQRLLAEKGHDVSTAADGPQALTLFEQRRPDVTIVDLNMPGMDGLQVLRRLRAIDPHATVVLLTGYATEELENQARQLGAKDVLKKGFSPDVIVSTVQRLLRQASDMTVPALPTPGSIPPARAAVTPSPASMPATERMKSSMPTTVLVVEDDDQLARLIEETLQMKGYRVLVAKDGDVAFRLFQTEDRPIDVLLTDVMLPRINGLDLTTLVQGHSPHTHIIVCSGQLSSAELAKTGMAYLPKPFSLNQLIETLDTLLPRPLSVQNGSHQHS